jgi:signal transduction histidine kinase
MNPLPRLLGLGLLAVLAALAFILAIPSMTHAPATTRAAASPASTVAPQTSRPLSTTALAQRLAFPLSLTAIVLTIALLVSLAVRSPRNSSDSKPPFAATQRAEVSALARLAESSAAQSAALAHERDVRQRAEADALLNQQLLNRSLEEKIRLGRDLHDGIIQSLYAAGLTIESARALAATDPAEADRRLAACLQSLNQSIRDVRTYIVGLAPENLRQAGFADALRSLAEELRAGRDVTFDWKIDETATAQLTPPQTTEALQIAREAISNALRHGAATRITVRLHPGDHEVCLLVQDNGKGFVRAQQANAGLGLNNMQARAARLGADLRIESQPATGTRVIFTLPLQPA